MHADIMKELLDEKHYLLLQNIAYKRNLEFKDLIQEYMSKGIMEDDEELWLIEEIKKIDIDKAKEEYVPWEQVCEELGINDDEASKDSTPPQPLDVSITFEPYEAQLLQETASYRNISLPTLVHIMVKWVMKQEEDNLINRPYRNGDMWLDEPAE